MAYVDLTTRFVYELQTVFGDFSKLANNDAFMKDNGWEDGTIGVFFQAAAPTGWTKITTADARALRIVSGSGGGVGGSQDPATTITLAHTHTISSDGSHTHLLTDHTAYLATSGSEQSSATSNIPIIALTAAASGFPEKALMLRVVAGAVEQFVAKNQMAMTGGPYTTGSVGTHNHGGATNSQLSDISLAYINVLFCSKDTSSGYTTLTSTFVHNTRHVFDYLDQLAENDAYNYARRTPAGTISIFGSATAPTGWTKLTTANAALLRVVSGTGGGSGGTADPASTITLAHDHGSVTSDGGHTHSMPAHTHELAQGSSVFAVGSNFLRTSGGQLRENSTTAGSTTVKLSKTATDGSGTSSSDGAHQHATGSSLTNISLGYFDSIQASKDSTGAPTSYTDYTTFFIDQALLAYQDLQVMADNDAYLYYHTMPSAAVMFFFQASAPLNWTKLTTQNDVLIRIVSGSTGGTGGGTSPLSSSFSLAHTHTLDTKSHTHTLAHTHTLDDGTSTLNASGGIIGTTRIFGGHGSEMYRAVTGAGSDTALGETTESVTVTTDSKSHNHTGLTGSSLSNVTLAYADVIRCSKN